MSKKGVKSVKKTTEQFKNEVYNVEKNNYIVLGDYTGTNDKLLMKHVECGHEYLVTPNKFLQGRRCPMCRGTHKKTNESFNKELIDKGMTNIELIGEYKNNRSLLLIKNKKCGHEYEMRPSDILKDRNCPICQGYIRNLKDFQSKLDSRNLNFDVISEYVSKRTPIKIRCRKCGVEKEILPESITKHSTKCICDYSSIPEKEIETFLQDMKITHTRQQVFDDLKNRNYLPFDFMIPVNGRMLLIEYDGEFHFNDIYFNQYAPKGELFKKRRRNDIIKNEYCINSNIQLLRIPYWSRKNKNEIILSVIKLLESSTTIQKWSTVEAYWKREASYLLI